MIKNPFSSRKEVEAQGVASLWKTLGRERSTSPHQGIEIDLVEEKVRGPKGEVTISTAAAFSQESREFFEVFLKGVQEISEDLKMFQGEMSRVWFRVGASGEPESVRVDYRFRDDPTFFNSSDATFYGAYLKMRLLLALLADEVES